jgi:hypothetical protein
MNSIKIIRFDNEIISRISKYKTDASSFDKNFDKKQKDTSKTIKKKKFQM